MELPPNPLWAPVLDLLKRGINLGGVPNHLFKTNAWLKSDATVSECQFTLTAIKSLTKNSDWP